MKYICMGVLLAVLPGAAVATMSPNSRLVPDPEHSLFWRTYLTEQGGITWEWPKDAVSARLTLTDRTGTHSDVLGRDVSSYVPAWPVSAADEDVLDLRVEFFAAAGADGEAMSGETLEAHAIGLVRGVNGRATDLRCVAPSSRKWTKVAEGSRVFPIPDGATSLSCNGADRSFAFAPGWCLCSPLNEGDEWALQVGEALYGRCQFQLSGGLLMMLK